MRVNPNYTCPRCGYTTDHKGAMNKHFTLTRKTCPSYCDPIVELTDEIKEHVLLNRVYRPPITPIATAPLSEKRANTGAKSRSKIPKKVRIETWDRYIGMDKGRVQCMCCEAEYMTQMTFHCGHVVSHADGGSMNIDNLRPICASCNLSMHTQNMNEFRQEFFGLGEVRGGV